MNSILKNAIFTLFLGSFTVSAANFDCTPENQSGSHWDGIRLEISEGLAPTLSRVVSKKEGYENTYQNTTEASQFFFSHEPYFRMGIKIANDGGEAEFAALSVDRSERRDSQGVLSFRVYVGELIDGGELTEGYFLCTRR